jgi:Mn-dependent DtxR family transcriptional regulator
MSLSPIKQEILETLLLNSKPMKPVDIAKETNKEFKMVTGHLLGLAKAGAVKVPEKGSYIITDIGRKALGIQEVTKEKAVQIIAYAPHDKSFIFYAELGKPLNIHAHSLRDFANKLEKIDASAIGFHVKRGDFEAWFIGLGDLELAKKTALLKQKNLAGEDIRKHLHGIVEQRYIELAKLSGQTVPE